MAIENESGNWNEETINMLYRAYQEHRDGVDYRHYRSIMQAARNLLAERKLRPAAENQKSAMEQRLATILAEAKRLYPEVDQVESIEPGFQGPTGRDRESVSDRLQRWTSEVASGMERFFESISPARLVPIAITAALVVAVVPFVTTPDGQNDDLMAAQVALLQQSPNSVANELERLGEYQHGFSSGDSGYARAFSAGAALVDLKVLDPDANAEQIDRIVASARNSVGTVNIAIDPSDSPAQQVAALTGALDEYYQSNEHSPVYLFGQWVESAYLLSRIGEQTGSTGGIAQAMAQLPEIQLLMRQGGYLAPRISKDLDALGTILEQGLDAQSLPRVSARLLKMRTVEARQRG